MLLDFMDFDPRILSGGHGWHYNFHFGNGYDIIEEDVANEKSCVQALRYLIAKADAEIDDLEDELAVLQCQLKWAKSDGQRDPYEVCCATFKRKIDMLSKSIKDARDKKILNEHDKGTTKIQVPTERIYDIISALIEQNLSSPDEQVEDRSNELNLLIDSGSIDTDMEKETAFESCAESKELSIEFERLCKPAATVSEESCSDATRYVTRDSIEARDINKTNVEVIGQKKDDVYECTPAGENVFIACVQAYNDSVNSKSRALHHGEIEEYVTGSKNSGSSSSPVSSKTEVIVKVEKDDDTDMSIQLVAADFLCNTQDLKSEDPDEGHHQLGKKNKSQRNKSSLSSILKPSGQKVKRKYVKAVRQSNLSLMLMPQRSGKRENPSKAADFGQSNSPALLVNEGSSSLPEVIQQRKPGDIAHTNLPRLLEPQEVSSKNASIQSHEVIVSKGADLCARSDLAAKMQKQLVFGLESPLAAEGIPLLLDSSPEHVHTVESKSAIAEDVETKELASYDKESLTLKLSQDSDFLNKMRVPELKRILKFFKVRGFSKLKKENMIEELTKVLSNT
ncbi:uncharacterized protein LOC110691557 [Chenopodium quinoa]|uniref:uncharacterized protein LOC110691557 n=1 Tax=Chenopodium quinoa TaxID=63459 RepID=UPI000B78B94C|nr:uncharacterized protein LOC110691557 [Chenopodium quinoa]XP_021724187.1 uncharacterized protein LOC110691557 [Chenopodium quinoa]